MNEFQQILALIVVVSSRSLDRNERVQI